MFAEIMFANAQADLGLRRPHMSEDTFRMTLPIWNGDPFEIQKEKVSAQSVFPLLWFPFIQSTEHAEDSWSNTSSF